jgi:DNA-binding transcriptional MerR regulator
MNVFSIKDIENMTGIKCHTLRIWEQRYNIIAPKRKESKHRIYDNEDLKYFLRISYLYHKGYKISKIASLNEEQIRKLSLEARSESDFARVFVNRMVESAIDFDQPGFEQVLQNVFLHLGFEKAITEVIYPFLQKMGLLWMTDHVIPAQEHFSSHLIRKKMMVMIDGLPLPESDPNKNFVLFTPEGELHEIPLLFIKYLLKRNHIPTAYFGTNVPLKDIAYYCRYKNVKYIYCHIITNFVKLDINDYIDELCNSMTNQIIVISGPVVHSINREYPNLRLLRSFEDMLKFPATIS